MNFMYTQEELKACFEDEEIHCEKCNFANKNVYEYLGSFAAEDEWDNDPSEAKKRFLNINAYKQFKDNHFIVLIGRTGTGKTSIIKKVVDEIQQNSNTYFKHCIELSLKDYLFEIPNYGEIDTSIRSMVEIEKNLQLYIKLSIMKYIVSHKERFSDTKNFRKSFDVIDKYLINKRITKDTDIVHRILSEITRIESEGNIGKTISFISQLTLNMTGEDYDEALSAMASILQGNPFLLLIDTLERYDINDIKILAIVRALIALSYNCAWKFNKDNLFIKIAIPSEIYTQVREQLPAKYLGREIFIEWNYKDLVKMLAIKFYCLAIKRKELFGFIRNYSLSDLYDDSQMGIKLIYEILPAMTKATIDMKFDTLAYCIRHTQKKPRQILMIINALLGEIIETKDVNYLKNNSEEVRCLIHSVQDEMLRDSISLYQDSIPELLSICSEAISEKKYFFTAKELGRYLHKISKVHKKQLDIGDIERLLIESGIIGLKENEQYINRNSAWFQNEKVVRIINASFEYQIKGQLVYNENSTMVIHPMCYEYFKCLIGKYTMVYPDKDGDPEDFLNQVLAKTDVENNK